MEYKNAYERLIEAVRTLLKNNPSDEGIQNWAKDNVPEIFESEDERIRKELLAWLKSTDGQTLPIDRYNAAIAWLKKQGEQKVIVPKFRVGDKVRLKGSCGWYNVTEIRGNAYYLTSNDVVPCLLPICEQDNWEVEQKPAWSEEDKVTINRIVACLENLNVADNDILLKDVDWLKSIIDRCVPIGSVLEGKCATTNHGGWLMILPEVCDLELEAKYKIAIIEKVKEE